MELGPDTPLPPEPVRADAVRLALWILFLVFAARVLLQFGQTALGLDGPVPATAWDCGFLPYSQLLMAQLGLGALLIAIIRRVDGQRRRTLGSLLAALGLIYLVAMLTRAAVSFLSLSDAGWFHMPVPTSFHIVLAAILLIAGSHMWQPDHRTRQALRAALRPVLYPLVIGAGLVLFAWSLRSGLPVPVAAYHALALGAVAIVVSELLMPYRADWAPGRNDLVTDAAYLAFVQVALPALASALVVYGVGHYDLSLVDLWPDRLPVALQVILMLVVADFGRYWLHRASHAWPALWQLHAVHHAPEDLHALNVGRFHPVEKTLQFALDTVPFILLGVSDTVVAGYLVFYALNGFFQHANVDARLGLLNWIISGPELHRWHHARDPRLSDHNFGNNLIIWDALFGTRMLPANRHVDALGLRNRSYPRGLFAQIAAPFTINPNKEFAK